MELLRVGVELELDAVGGEGGGGGDGPFELAGCAVDGLCGGC